MGTLDWWWSPHPAWEPGENWDANVPVVRYETETAVVLFDPFLPPQGAFDPHGKPVNVLLTEPGHVRGTADFVERYGASVWVPPRAVWRRGPDPRTTTDVPDGVEVCELDGVDERVAFFIPEHRTLVSGDVISSTGGTLHVFVDDGDAERLLPALERLADLPIERLIFPHGGIVDDGAAQIRAAVAASRPG